MFAKGSTLMTEGSVWKKITFFALPVFYGNLFQQMYNAVDSLVVGNFVGAQALAAVSSSGTLIMLIVGMMQGIFIGGGVVISRYYGARDATKVSESVHSMALFALIAGSVLTVLGVSFTPSILRMIGVPDVVLPNSILYFRVYFAGVLAPALYNAASGILQAIGDSRHPLLYLLISSVLNVILDLLFVLGFHWGVGGVAVATVISQAVSAVCAWRYLCRSSEEYKVDVRLLRFNWPMLRYIFRMGVPAGVQNSVISFANLVVQSQVNSFGAMAMAGCGVYSRLEGFAFLPIMSFGLAMTTFIGQNLGAGLYDRAKRGTHFALGACCATAQLIALTIYIFAPELVRAFNDTPGVISYGVAHARIITPFYFLVAICHCMAGILRGAGKAVIPMAAMLTCWCVIRLMYLMIILSIDHRLCWLSAAYPMTWALCAVVLIIYYLKADWLHGLIGSAERQCQ